MENMDLQKLFEIAGSQGRSPVLDKALSEHSQVEKHTIRSLSVQYNIKAISFNGELVDTNEI